MFWHIFVLLFYILIHNNQNKFIKWTRKTLKTFYQASCSLTMSHTFVSTLMISSHTNTLFCTLSSLKGRSRITVLAGTVVTVTSNGVERPVTYTLCVTVNVTLPVWVSPCDLFLEASALALPFYSGTAYLFFLKDVHSYSPLPGELKIVPFFLALQDFKTIHHPRQEPESERAHLKPRTSEELQGVINSSLLNSGVSHLTMLTYTNLSKQILCCFGHVRPSTSSFI